MFVVIVEFETQKKSFDAFVTRVRQQADDSLRLETECHQFDVCIDPERSNFVLLYEIYSSKQAFDDHLASQHFLDFNQEVQDWVSDKKVSVYEKL